LATQGLPSRRVWPAILRRIELWRSGASFSFSVFGFAEPGKQQFSNSFREKAGVEHVQDKHVFFLNTELALIFIMQ